MTVDTAKLAKIAEQVKQLLDLSASAKEIGSLAEAEVAAAKAAELMVKYNLSREVVVTQEKRDDTIYQAIPHMKGSKSVVEWQLQLGAALASAGSVLCAFTKENGFFSVIFFGDKDCTQICAYQFSYLVSAIEIEVDKSYRRNYARTKEANPGWRPAFIAGCITGLTSKLKEAVQKAEQEYREQEGAETTALAVISRDQRLARLSDRVLGPAPKMHEFQRLTGNNNTAYNKGFQWGRTVEVPAALPQSNEIPKLRG